MLCNHVRLQQSSRTSQCCVRVSFGTPRAQNVRVKKIGPKAAKSAFSRHAPICKQRIQDGHKNNDNPLASKYVHYERATRAGMAGRMMGTFRGASRPTSLASTIAWPKPAWTSVRQITQSLTYSQKSGSDHDDLQSFLAYAKRHGLDETSNVFKGTKYEYRVIESLREYGLELERIGRAGDRGKDFEGTWKLHKHTKKQPNEVSVVGQCKATKVGPAEVRQLIGTSTGGRDCIRILVSKYKASKGTVQEVRGSTQPMVFVQMNTDGEVNQFLWNPAATEAGLGRLGMTVRYGGDTGVGDASREAEGSKHTETIVLTWDGRPWRPKSKKSKAKRNVILPRAPK